MEEIKKYFLRDAAKAFVILEDTLGRVKELSGDDMKNFIISIHGMKTALTVVNQTDLADAAYKLEQAGKARDFTFMESEIPKFAAELKHIVAEFNRSGEKISSEEFEFDATFVKNKLNEIIFACGTYDKNKVKANLNELSQMRLPSEATANLQTMFVHLMHSEFKKIAAVADETAGSV